MREHWFTGKNWPTTATLIVIISWMIVLGIYWNTTASMVHTWYHTVTFKHGFFVFPISAFLIWARRSKLTSLRPTPKLWPVLLLAGLGFGWLLGNLTHLQVVQQVAMIAMLPVMAWILLGTEVCYTLLFPLGFLFFAVPGGEFLVPWLQDFTAFFTVKALQLSSIPVFWEGRSISIPGQTWLVTESCSGIRYVISMLALGCLFASVIFRTWVRRILFILASLFLPIVFNGLRAYSIVLLAYFSGGELAVGIDHFIYGWVFFLLLIFPLCWIGLRWREVDMGNLYPDKDKQATSLPSGHNSIRSPGDRNISPNPLGSMALATSAAVMVLIAPPLLARTFSNSDVSSQHLTANSPSIDPPWEAIKAKGPPPWTPKFSGAQAVVNQSYVNGQQKVHFTFAYYVQERQGAELIGHTNTLMGGEGRIRLLAETSMTVTVDGHPLEIQESIIRSSAYGNRLVWHWYWVADQYTSSPSWAKLLQVKAKLWDGTETAAMIVVSTKYTGQPTESQKILQDFLYHTSILQTLKDVSP